MNIAIHAHVFYPELWDELASCIRNFQGYPYDLFVTTPHSDKSLQQKILSDFPHADYRILENRGYDLGPFVDVLNSLDLSKYDYIVKLHTKRDWSGWFNFMHVHGPQWRNMLLSFCRTRQAVETGFNVFLNDPSAGMIADASLIVTHGDYLESENVQQLAEQLLRRAKIIPTRRIFVGGTMFMARAKLFKPIQGLLQPADFETVQRHELGTLAHTCERLLGYAVVSQGMKVISLGRPKNSLSLLWPIIVPTYRVLAFIRNQMPDRRRERRLRG